MLKKTNQSFKRQHKKWLAVTLLICVLLSTVTISAYAKEENPAPPNEAPVCTCAQKCGEGAASKQ